MDTCQICLKQQQGHGDPYFIAEKGRFKIYHSPVNAQLLGYFYVEPSRHVEFWTEFSEEERRELPDLIAELEQWLKVELDAQKVYTLTVGEVVRHLHIHLIPRSSSSPLDSLELIQQVAVRKGTFTPTAVTDEDIQRVIAKLRVDLK